MRMSLRAVVAAAGIAALAVTTGCGGGGDTPTTPDAGATPTTGGDTAAETTGAPQRDDADLVIWTDELKIGAVTEIAEGFGEENGITVAVQAVTDLQSNFITANAASNGPDVVVGAHDWIGNMVQNGAIDPLQITADQVSQYSPVAVDAVTYDEQLYGLPYGVEALVLYRNTDLVPEAPATLDEAFATGLELKAAGTVQSAFNLPVGELGDAYHMQPLYTSLGGYVFGRGADGGYDAADLGVGDEASQAAGARIAELGEGGSGALTRSVSGDNSIALFADGQAPFLLSGPWARSDVEAAGFGWDVQAVPGFEGAGPAQPFTGIQAFYVASAGANKAFAQEFVGNAMNTEEAMKVMYDGANIPPSLTSLQESEVAADPQLQAYLDAANAGEPMPSIPQMGAVFEPLGQAYSAIIGGADGAETMVATGDTIRTAIAE